MPLHDVHYQHWEGQHLGIWHRRAVIAKQGLKACLQVKWMRYIVTLCWAGALLQVIVLFFLGQLLVPDSLIVQWLGNLNPRLQNIARGLMTWLAEHPEVSVRTTYNLLFYYFTSNLVTFTFIAIALAIPHLITRDLSSNAIVVYASKAIGWFDYLLSKLATIFGLMILTWLGPVCVAWFVGNLLSTHWHFFWHSRVALFHVLAYAISSMMVLSILALGISAVSSKARTTVSLWMVLWLLGNALVPIALQTKPWLKHLSLEHNLQQIALTVFHLKEDFQIAQNNIPLLGQLLRGLRDQRSFALENPESAGALIGIGVLVALSLIVIARKVKPE
ncbi:MAG: hypothetical protein HY735_01440 [Verrucomicrobia bacterium]|nr:hypothetical protein [Verrucomicrobiota bacterium]